MGVGFLRDGLLSNAETVLKQAVRNDPYSHEAWAHLGTTMSKLGSVAVGEEYVAALDLESSVSACPRGLARNGALAIMSIAKANK